MKKTIGLSLILVLSGCGEDETATEPTMAELLSQDVRIIENDDDNSVFISSLDITIPTKNIDSVGFSIQGKEDALANEVSTTYQIENLILNETSLKLPIWGMYSNYANNIDITITFDDSSKIEKTLQVETGEYVDSNGIYDNISINTQATSKLSYSYFYLENSSNQGPVIMDVDGNVRWVSSGIVGSHYRAATFDGQKFIIQNDNNILTHLYLSGDEEKFSFDVPGLSDIDPHHETSKGKFGYLLNINATKNGERHLESIVLEVGEFGEFIDEWDFGEIISKLMVDNGEDPSLFVRPGVDWLHINSAIYDPSDDSIIVSGRESFVIKVDYSSKEIKWILGDETKYWATFPSLLALSLSGNDIKPMGEHALSIVGDELLMFNNGQASFNQPSGAPVGETLLSSLAMKWLINEDAMSAENTWTYDAGIWSDICSSVYQKGENYLVTYSAENRLNDADNKHRIQGLDSDSNVIFDFEFPGVCNTWNSDFIELSNLQL